MGELWSCSTARLTNGSAQDLARQYLRTVTYADWEEGAKKHAHKRDSHGVADQGRNKPDGKLEAGVIVRKVRQPMRHLRDTKKSVQIYDTSFSDLCSAQNLISA